MKILLTIRKEYREIINPIAILDLAAYARKIGHEVDCYYFFQINKKSFKKKYDLVGLSVLQANGKQSIRDAIFLKKKFNVRTIVGGKWTDTINEESTSILEKNNIEIFKGHGEKLFSDNKIEYDSYPSWDIVDFKTLNDVRGDIMSSRGCPFKCHFCHNTERKVEFFNEKRVANNIQLLFSLNIDNISFVDDVFTINPKRMMAVYQELKSRNISIEHRNCFASHIKYINDETLTAINKFKPKAISIGIESGDDRVLKLMGKNFVTKEAFEKIKLLHENGHAITVLFLIGFPGENIESIKNTLAFIKKIKPYIVHVWVSYYQPVPGTVGYARVLEKQKNYNKDSQRNKFITYIEPGLSKQILKKYRTQMMNEGQLRTKYNMQRIIHIIKFIFHFISYNIFKKKLQIPCQNHLNGK